ncbi:hypothetical protein [Acetivibrio ethanolgignens]|nr:hypothetical protein [Acetivibrio ethanolgignens]
MGLFSWFFRKKQKEEKILSPEQKFFSSRAVDEEKLFKEAVAQPLAVDEDAKEEARRQLQEARVEYEAVTSYLTDIQRIDMVPEEERKSFTEAAEKILLFKGEREKYKNQEIKLSERHRNSMELYEESLPQELKAMQEKEQYQSVIKNDMRHLEGEKGVLLYERDEIVEKQENLKKLAVTAAALVVSLLILLALLDQVFEAAMQLPFLLTVLMGVVSAAYIIYESRQNRKNMVLTEKKLARAIGLLNKVKIKYVNNTSCLEYAYEKLGVESSMELEYVWKQYLLLKEREKQFRSTTEKINQYNQILITELKKIDVRDAEVWTYQPEALLDKREMVEVRHRLNVRRQKLRDRMDYNNKLLGQE